MPFSLLSLRSIRFLRKMRDVDMDSLTVDTPVVAYNPATQMFEGAAPAGPGSGESNTASNVGTAGVGVFKEKSGVELRFKKLKAVSDRVTVTDNTGASQVDLDVPLMVASGASHAAGAVPDPGSSAGTTKYLREDATWQVPAGGGSGGVLFSHYADTGNVTTGETDLYSDAVPAAALAVNGAAVQFRYGVKFVGSTSSKDVRTYFGGTALIDTGALAITVASAMVIEGQIVRESSTVVRYDVSVNTAGVSTQVYAASGRITGLTLSSDQTLKITGQASGVGAATNDIIANEGAIWQPGGTSSGGGGNWTLISDTVLGSDTANFDLTSIPGTYKHLKLICQLRGTDSGTVVAVDLKFNNDGGSHYAWLRHTAYNNASHAVQVSDSTSPPALGTEGRGGYVAAAGAASGYATALEISIPRYAGTTFAKTAQVRCSGIDGDIRDELFVVFWNQTEAIARITLIPAAGNFLVGSSVSLYGLS